LVRARTYQNALKAANGHLIATTFQLQLWLGLRCNKLVLFWVMMLWVVFRIPILFCYLKEKVAAPV
jgi:hypothetical protein